MKFSKVILDQISKNLRERKETIAAAESVTSGFLQLAFSQMLNAQQIYNGGITAYTLEQKVKHLKVDSNEAKETDCVSSNITESMALNVANLFDADWSVAITGYATPVPESQGEVFAYYAIAYKNRIVLSERTDLHPMTKPLDAQKYFMECVLSNLDRCLTKDVQSLTTNY